MVQEKDGAKKRAERRTEFMRKSQEILDANTIKFSWHVIEHTPEYNTGGYDDVNIPAEYIRVSPWFDTEGEAIGWMDIHEPDEGKSLHVRRMRLLSKTYTDWVNY